MEELTVDLDKYKPENFLKKLIVNGFVILENWESQINNKNQVEEQFKELVKNRELISFNDYSTIEENQELRLSRYAKIEKLNTLIELPNLLNSLVCKSFDLNYGFLDEYCTDNKYLVETNQDRILNWDLISIIYINGGSQLKLRSSDKLLRINKSSLILSIGKIFEFLSKGLIFNNIVGIESNNFLVIHKQVNYNLKLSELIAKLSPSFVNKKHNFNKIFNDRIFQINKLFDSTISQNNGKSYNRLKENINTGETHMFGYSKNNQDYLNISNDLNFINLSIKEDGYLIKFKIDESIGNLMIFEIFFKFNKKVFTKSTINYQNFEEEKVRNDLQFLLRIFSNLDNLIFTYFLNHINPPNLKKYLSNLKKMTGKPVEMFDILKIKVLYNESYILLKDGDEVLINLDKTQLNQKNFTRLINDRKVKFEKIINTLNLKDYHKLDLKVNELFNNLAPVPKNPINNSKEILKRKIVLKNKIEKPAFNQDKKLSLLERIKLKEKQKSQVTSLNNLLTSGRSDLELIFGILNNIHSNNFFKTFPMDSLILKIVDSLKSSQYNLLNNEEVFKILIKLNKIFQTEDFFEILNFNPNPHNENHTKVLIKYNFFNKRQRILELIKKT